MLGFLNSILGLERQQVLACDLWNRRLHKIFASASAVFSHPKWTTTFRFYLAHPSVHVCIQESTPAVGGWEAGTHSGLITSHWLSSQPGEHANSTADRAGFKPLFPFLALWDCENVSFMCTNLCKNTPSSQSAASKLFLRRGERAFKSEVSERISCGGPQYLAQGHLGSGSAPEMSSPYV